MVSLDPAVERALALRFERAMRHQLDLLDRPTGHVAATGASGLGRASGYLLGVCESIIEQQGLDLGTTPYFGSICAYAFHQTYGEDGEKVGLASIEGMRNRDPAIMEGQRAGRQDMTALVAGTPGEPTGFYALATAAVSPAS